MYRNYYQNKTVLVTGGGSGIGQALCLELAKTGAIVICTDVQLDKALATASQASAAETIIAKKLDVTQLGDFELVIKWIVETYGKLDVLINNAGIFVCGELRDIATPQWKQIVDINLLGVIYGSQTAYAQMLKQGSGQIVNIASLAGLVKDLVTLVPYNVTKQAVVSYSRSLRLEAKQLNVKVNVFCPGYIRTRIVTDGTTNNTTEAWADVLNRTINVKGIGPDKAARYILGKTAANKGVVLFPFIYHLLLWATVVFSWPYRAGIQSYLKIYRKKYRNSGI